MTDILTNMTNVRGLTDTEQLVAGAVNRSSGVWSYVLHRPAMKMRPYAVGVIDPSSRRFFAVYSCVDYADAFNKLMVSTQ